MVTTAKDNEPAGVRSKTGKHNPVARLLTRLQQDQIVFAVAIVMACVFAAILPTFRTIGNTMSLLNNVAVIGILALGAGVVIIGRGLDISQVASMVASSSVAAVLIVSGAGLGWALFAGLGLAIAIGLINGFLVAFVEIPSLFATLGMMLFIFGLDRVLIAHGQYVIYLKSNADTFSKLGGQVGAIPIPILIFAAMAALIYGYLRYTKYGRYTYAHGDNPETARQSGIPVRVLTLLEYTISSSVAYIAGLVMMAELGGVNSSVILGPMIFDVILVAVLGGLSLVGGRGSVFSIIAGTLLIAIVINGMTLFNLNSDIQNIIRALVLLGAIVLDNSLHPRDEETARQGE